jgi:hypothetical protein
MPTRSFARAQGLLTKLSGPDALLDRAGYGRENVVGVAADQPDGADNNNQNHSQHNSIFSDVLPAIIVPQTA